MNNLLQELFAKGSAPKNLDGSFRGKLVKLLPASPLEMFGGFVAKIWLPWHGKTFNKNLQTGSNQLPAYLLSVLKYRYGEKIIVGRNANNINVFPFKTKITKGLKDNIFVLQLNYDLPENPQKVREVIDELVQVGENAYLGKAYLKERKNFRLVAFFNLEK